MLIEICTVRALLLKAAINKMQTVLYMINYGEIVVKFMQLKKMAANKMYYM